MRVAATALNRGNDSLTCVSLPSQNDVDAVSKAAPTLASAKVDGSNLSKPSGAVPDDSEMKKVLEECKRLQSDVGKLQDENRQLRVKSRILSGGRHWADAFIQSHKGLAREPQEWR